MGNKKIRPAIVRFSFSWLSLLAACFLGYFEVWGYFGATLTLAVIIALGAYLENHYRRIALRFDQLEELIRKDKHKLDESEK